MAPYGDAIGLYIKIVGKIRAAESDYNSFTLNVCGVGSRGVATRGYIGYI